MKKTNSLRKYRASCHILALAALLPVTVQADRYRSETDHDFSTLVPVSVPAPEHPQTRLGPGPEGWIKLRFSVKADGTTSNIEVLDYMPGSFSERDTVRTVESWTFEPATAGGEAVDWHNNIVTINFDLEEIPIISGPNFTEPYAEIQELITEERFDRAERQAIRNLSDVAYTLHDIGMGNIQLAILEMRKNDMHLAHQAIVRATLPEVTQLTDEELDIALQYRFNIELALGRLADAMRTFERRQALVDIPAEDVMHEQVSQVREALEGGYPLGNMGKILDRDVGWFFEPSRRTFTIANVDGEVDTIEAVCNRRAISLEYQPEVEWTLPDSWGDCSIQVMGDRGTTFSFYEFPDQ